MNAEQISQFAAWLLDEEENLGVQQSLQNITSHLTNMIAQPQSLQYQNSLVESLNLLETEVRTIAKSYDISEWRTLERIGASPYFSLRLYDDIKEILSKHSITPAVALTEISQLAERRNAYIASLENVRNGLSAIGVVDDDIEHPEIGFQIPRDLFKNNLDGLINELRAIKRILRAASEMSVGSVESITVRQIHTSNPTFYFSIATGTIVNIGLITNWCIEKWKQIEDIRKVRAETKKLSSFTNEEVENFFDAKIKAKIEKDIDEKLSALIGPQGVSGRKAEQRIDMAWALEAMLARIERGLIVEIRLPPPPSDVVEGDVITRETDQFQELRELNNEMKFPAVEGAPVLNLPKMSSDEEQPASRNRKRRQETDASIE